MTGSDSLKLSDPQAYWSPRLEQASAAVLARCKQPPQVGLVLGSGLGNLADEIETACVLRFDEIPHHPSSSVVGHAGQLVLGELEGVQVAAWRGRLHFYEGHSMVESVFPIRLMRQLGAEVAILTNAAGGLRQDLIAGDLMLLVDHLNLPGLAGHNPLRGPHDVLLGERFVDLSAAYDPDLRQLAREVAQRLGFPLPEGVYVMVSGPNYETPAEARLLRMLGADAVGMSTVPEVIAARQVGLRVLALSAITNVLSGEPGTPPLSHQEVVDAGERTRPRLSGLVRGILARLSEVLTA